MGTRLYVGHLPNSAHDRDLEYFFRGFGPIRDVVVKNGFGFVEFEDYRDAEEALYQMNGRSFQGQRVTVERTKRPPKGRDADRSRYSYGGRFPDNRDFDRRGGGGRDRGRGPTKFGPSSHTKWRATVENLSSKVSWQDLKDFFRSAAEVSYADAHKERNNEGIVCFASEEDMKRAIEKLDGKELSGRKVKIVPESQARKRSRSHSGSPDDKKRARRSSGGSDGARKSRSKSKSKSRSKSRSRSGSRKSGTKSPVEKAQSDTEEKTEDKEEKKENGEKDESTSPAPDTKENGEKEGSKSRTPTPAPDDEGKDEDRRTESKSRSPRSSEPPADEGSSGSGSPEPEENGTKDAEDEQND